MTLNPIQSWSINRTTKLIFILGSLLSIFLWFLFAYPQFRFINLSVDQKKALKIAREFVQQHRQIDLSSYTSAVAFSSSQSVDRYLQMTIGHEKEIVFLKKEQFDLFAWSIRFFRELEREEYSVNVSASTGEVVGYSYGIDNIASRPDYGMDQARQTAIDFLQKRFEFNPDNYIVHSELTSRQERRNDYHFTWEKKNVFIPWSPLPNTGGAKVLIGASVSGSEILSFTKRKLEIPPQYYRHLSEQETVAKNLSILVRILYFILLTTAVFFVLAYRHHLVSHRVKRFCVAVTLASFGLSVIAYFNSFQNILMGYDTTASMRSFLWRDISYMIFDNFQISLAILMPLLAGESLRYEVLRHNPLTSFQHFLTSTFLSRTVAGSVWLGYGVGLCLIGLQTMIFEFGQRYFHVWHEYSWMTRFSSSTWPLLSTVTYGLTTSSDEEIFFRLFLICLGLKLFRQQRIAILLSAIIWGINHSGYFVFPFWFRSVEITFMGMFLGGIFLRFGIIPVLTAHYLFNVFWATCSHLLGQSTPGMMISSSVALLLPFGLSIIPYVVNRPDISRPMTWRLNHHQLFNCDTLVHYLVHKKILAGKSPTELEILRREIISHGWDAAVVDRAFEICLKNAESRGD